MKKRVNYAASIMFVMTSHAAVVGRVPAQAVANPVAVTKAGPVASRSLARWVPMRRMAHARHTPVNRRTKAKNLSLQAHRVTTISAIALMIVARVRRVRRVSKANHVAPILSARKIHKARKVARRKAIVAPAMNFAAGMCPRV